ncbi:MAG: hypothetical protein WEA61_04335 [Anaerolineales bacterium]
MLKTLLRIIVVPILILFVVALPLSLVLRNVGNVLFDAETTKALARESLMGSELAASLARGSAEQIISSENAAGEGGEGEDIDLSAVLGQLTEEDWRQITEIVAPEELVAQTVDVMVEAFSAWLNDADAAFPDLHLDLTGLKANAADKASQVMVVILDALPACSADAASTFISGAAGVAAMGAIPACRPEEPVYTEIITQVGGALGQMVSRTPDTFDLSQITQGQDAPEELVRLRESLIRLRFGLAWGWVAVLAIGLLAAALAAHGFISFLRWSGWPIMISGLLTLALGLSVFAFTFSFLESLLSSTIGSDSTTMNVLASAVAGGVLNQVGGPLLLQGAIATVLGLGVLWYAGLLDRRVKSPGIPVNRKKIGL